MWIGIISVAVVVIISYIYLQPTDDELILYHYMSQIAQDVKTSLTTIANTVPDIKPLDVTPLKVGSKVAQDLAKVKLSLPTSIDLSTSLSKFSCPFDLSSVVTTNKATSPKESCPRGYWNVGGVCWGCPSGWKAKDKIICTKGYKYECPCFPNVFKKCTCHGTRTESLRTTLAKKTCPSGHHMWGGLCVPPCPSGHTRVSVNLCVRK